MVSFIIEEEMNNHIEFGNGWGLFVELDVQPQKRTKIPFKNPRKFYNVSIPQGMETINEETVIDIYNEDKYGDYSYDEKKENAIEKQIYSGFAICALAAYICFMI